MRTRGPAGGAGSPVISLINSSGKFVPPHIGHPTYTHGQGTTAFFIVVMTHLISAQWTWWCCWWCAALMAVYHSLIAFVAYPMPLCTYTCSHIHCHRFKTDTALKTFLNIGVFQVIQPPAHYVRAISSSDHSAVHRLE